MDSAFNSCLIDMDSNPAKTGHCVTDVGKLFTPTVSSGAEGQLISGIASNSVATLGKLSACISLRLLSLSSLIGG